MRTPQRLVGSTLSVRLRPVPSPSPHERLLRPIPLHHLQRTLVNRRTQIRGPSRRVGSNNMIPRAFHLLSGSRSVLSTRDSRKAFFYVDTAAPNPAPTWTHPLGSPSVSPWPNIGSTTSPAPAPAKITSPPPQPATPGEPENPDKRPLPTGWTQQYDPKYIISSSNIPLTNRWPF